MRDINKPGHAFNVIQRENFTIFLDFQLKGAKNTTIDATFNKNMIVEQRFQQFWFVRTK